MLLTIGDLHLTDQVRDEHRFKIFKWIARQQESNPVAATFLAGDLTDAKNRHSATLVNKVVDGLKKLKPPIYICCGNHDYHDPANPFFRFLSHIDGITFVHTPLRVVHQISISIIPHYRVQADFDTAVQSVGPSDMFLVHQTFEGAIAETGALLSGLRASAIESLKPRLGVLAGDVHRPQTQGIVTYIGCPYHVRFGDNFLPRVLLLNERGKRTSLYFDAPYKHSLRVRDACNILDNSDLAEGDQVKLTVELAREEAVEWKQIKAEILAACKEMGVDVYGCKLEVKTGPTRQRIQVKGPDSTGIVDTFCTNEKVSSQVRKAAHKLMEIKHNNGD